MIAAWGIIIPLAMSVALMCKSVCPGKAYVYVSDVYIITCMLTCTLPAVAYDTHAFGSISGCCVAGSYHNSC